MLYTLALMLTTLWLLGVANDYRIGGFIHLLPVIAVSWCCSTFISEASKPDAGALRRPARVLRNSPSVP
jgi:hypothetical protein